MRSVVCTELGAPLSVEELPSPELSGGVRIRVRAAGVNFADTLMVEGKYQVKLPPPFTPGAELAGVVEEVADDVTGLRPGDRVMAFVPQGAFAEEVVALAPFVRKIPDSMPFDVAAGFAIAYGTAHLALVHRGRLKAGETLVVTGAAGGVGLAAIEVGKALGANVIAVVSTAEKGALATAHGADHVVDLSQTELRAGLKAATKGAGVDVVLDNVGGDAFETCLRSLGWDGRILVVGFASGRIPQVPANLALVKNASIVGVYWGATVANEPDVVSRSFDALFEMFGAGRLKPLVSERLPLERASEALALLRERRAVGKVVLVP